MIFSLLFGKVTPLEIILSLLLTLPIMMLALSIHETAHGYVAWKCGDNTAYNLGRLTLNPLRHLDPVGLIMLVVFGFGWAKPVPINTRNFRNPKRGMALSALAGPAANLLLGLISTLLYGICWGIFSYYHLTNTLPAFWYTALSVLTSVFELGAYVNFIYMLFNLIPVPPFDGSRIALVFLPPKAYFGIMRYERQIMYGLLIVLFAISYLFDFSPFGAAAQWITGKIAYPLANAVLKALL